MNEKQRAFLTELADIFKKYGIDEVCSVYENVPLMMFASMGECLYIKRFINGKFEDIHTKSDSFEPDSNK
jgi:hypothetical protein